MPNPIPEQEPNMEAVATVVHARGFLPMPKWRKEAMNSGPPPSIPTIVPNAEPGIHLCHIKMTIHGARPPATASKHATGLKNLAVVTVTIAERTAIVPRM